MGWKPGESGNPNGRPKKGRTYTDLLMEKLDKETFVNKVIEMIKSGNSSVIEQTWNRVEGKVTDTHRIVDEDDNDMSITFNVNIVDKKKDV